MRSRLVNLELDIFEDYPFYNPLNQTQVEESSSKLKRFDNHEEKIRKTAAEKNALESFIYQIREMVEDETFKKFSIEEERKNATALAD